MDIIDVDVVFVCGVDRMRWNFGLGNFWNFLVQESIFIVIVGVGVALASSTIVGVDSLGILLLELMMICFTDVVIVAIIFVTSNL